MKHFVTTCSPSTRGLNSGVNKIPRSARSVQGFSLLEVLISIIIFSFGLLGMVGLQAAALQSNREARLQSVGVTLARELAEMMRGNKDVALLATANPYLGDFNTVPLAPATASYCLNVATGTTPCANATEIANAQMTEWLARVDSELPGAQVTVCVDAAPFDAGGLPVWLCTPPAASSSATAFVKIGWTRSSTDRTRTGILALDRAVRPAVIFPITPGNTL
jgi:type IV pilus assembly protein PilV